MSSCEFCKNGNIFHLEEEDINICTSCGKPQTKIDNIRYDPEDDIITKIDQKEEEKECLECGAPEEYFMKSEGHLTCTECGFVQEMIISDEPEWNNYKNDDGSFKSGQARTSYYVKTNNPFYKESTFMGKGLKCTYIKKDGTKSTFDLSRKHQQMNYDHKQRSFDNVKNYLFEKIGLTYHARILDIAEKFWAEIMVSGKVTRAGVRKGLIACCVYYACVENGFVKSPLAICKEFGMEDTKQFLKGDKEFKETFETHPVWGHLIQKTSTSNGFFATFCGKLGLEFHIQRRCEALYECHKKKLAKVIPKSAVAGIIYFICKKEKISLSKTKVSQVLGVCNPTLTKTLAIIEKQEKKHNQYEIIRKTIKQFKRKELYHEKMVPIRKIKK